MEFLMRNRNKSQTVRRWTKMLCCLTVLLFAFSSVQSQDLVSSDSDSLISKASSFSSNKVERDKRASALDQVISAEYEGVRLIQALENIAQKAGFKLSYSDKQVPLNKKVTMNLQNVTVSDVLWQILEGTGLRFGVSPNNHLVLLKRNDTKSEVQLETVTGTVTDSETGQTLPGVNILVKGTTTGTSTNADGQFQLDAPSLQDTLVFSFIGY